MLTESIARMDKEKAVPVTTAELQETGIRHLDLTVTYTVEHCQAGPDSGTRPNGSILQPVRPRRKARRCLR